MTSEINKVNYIHGVDMGSSLAGKALIPTSTGIVTGGMDISNANLINMISKPIYVDDYAWTSSSVLVAYPFPVTMFDPADSSRAFLRQVLGMFAYMKYSLRFRIKVNGSPFHKGLVQCSWIPGDENLPSYSFLSQNTAMVFPTMFVNAAGTSEYTLDIPAVFQQQYHVVNDAFVGDDPKSRHGVFLLFPVVPLEYAAGANATVNISIWYEIIDLQLAAPTLIRDLNSFTPPHSSLAHQGILDAVIDPLAGAVKATVVGAVDGIGSAVKGGVRSTVASIPIVGSFLAGIFDKPPLKTEPLKICRTSATSWVHGVGVSSAATLTVVPGLFRPPRSEEISIPATIKEYIKIPAILQQFDINTSTAAAKLVKSWSVDPTWPTLISNTVTFATPTTSAPTVITRDTPLSYMSKMFEMWRGTIKYTIEVVMSATTTCTLAFVWIPDANVLDYTDYHLVASQATNWVMDCNGPSTSHFEVKFFSRNVYKHLYSPDGDSSVIGSDGNFSSEHQNGTIGVYLINTVMSNVAAPTTVTVRVYVAAADDFEFVMPGGSLKSILTYGRTDVGYTPPPIVLERVEHQGITDDVVTSTQQVVMAQEVNFKPMEIIDQPVQEFPFLGESHMESSLFKRYQLLFSEMFGGGTTNNLFITIPVSPCCMGYVKTGAVSTERTNYFPGRYSTPLAHFSNAFKFWRGSLNYRIVLNGQSTVDGSPCVVKAFYRHVSPSLEFGGDQYATPGLCYQQDTQNIDMNPVTANMGTRARGSTMWGACGSHYGIELVTNVDAGVVDVNVPFYSECPVKTTMYNRPVSTAITAPDHIMCTVNDIDQLGNPGFPWNHMSGTLTFMVENPANSPFYTEIYIAAGDDLVFSYPIPPPYVQTFSDNSDHAIPYHTG